MPKAIRSTKTTPRKAAATLAQRSKMQLGVCQSVTRSRAEYSACLRILVKDWAGGEKPAQRLAEALHIDESTALRYLSGATRPPFDKHKQIFDLLTDKAVAHTDPILKEFLIVRGSHSPWRGLGLFGVDGNADLERTLGRDVDAGVEPMAKVDRKILHWFWKSSLDEDWPMEVEPRLYQAGSWAWPDFVTEWANSASTFANPAYVALALGSRDHHIGQHWLQIVRFNPCWMRARGQELGIQQRFCIASVQGRICLGEQIEMDPRGGLNRRIFLRAGVDVWPYGAPMDGWDPRPAPAKWARLGNIDVLMVSRSPSTEVDPFEPGFLDSLVRRRLSGRRKGRA